MPAQMGPDFRYARGSAANRGDVRLARPGTTRLPAAHHGDYLVASPAHHWIGEPGRFLETSPAAARLLGHSGTPTVSARALSQGRPRFQFRALVQRSTSKSCPGRGRLEHG